MLILYSLVRALVQVGYMYMYGQTLGWRRCVENRVGRRKEIHQESRGFEDEGLRTTKKKGRETETRKKIHC